MARLQARRRAVAPPCRLSTASRWREPAAHRRDADGLARAGGRPLCRLPPVSWLAARSLRSRCVAPATDRAADRTLPRPAAAAAGDRLRGRRAARSPGRRPTTGPRRSRTSTSAVAAESAYQPACCPPELGGPRQRAGPAAGSRQRHDGRVCWSRARQLGPLRSADRAIVRTRTLQRRRPVGAARPHDLALWTGNAGGIETRGRWPEPRPARRRRGGSSRPALAPDALKARPGRGALRLAARRRIAPYRAVPRRAWNADRPWWH